MNDILYDRLIYLLEKNEIISLYSNEDSENFCVGYILKINRDYILMQHISPNGKYDGYIFKKTSDIYRVGYDESYISFVFMIIERYDEYLSALFYVGIAGTFLNICWGKRKG